MVSVRVRTFALVMLWLLLSAAPAFAQISVTVAWDRNSEPEVTGYAVYWGTQSGAYTSGSADVGSNTQYMVNGLDPDRRWYFVVRAYTADGLFSAPSTEVSTNGVMVKTGGTLIDDRPNIFWHNRDTGRVVTWHMNGATVVDSRPLSVDGVSDTNWKIAGVGDFNGDRFSDILWRHATNGSLAVWLLQGNLVIGTQFLSVGGVADLNWRIGGVGDVNADGYADIVWQHSSGGLAVWFVRGSTVLSTTMLPYNLGPNTVWQIAAIGDVNRDGYADIVFQTTDGFLAVWQLRSGTVVLTQYLSVPRMPDGNWRIKAVASPDNTGFPAVVWQHSETGHVALWYLNGATVVATIMTTPTTVDDLDWKIVGAR